MHELDFINHIRRSVGQLGRAVLVGPGDDCAVLGVGGERLLVTVDQVLDGVHFLLAAHGPSAAGRKALARSLSDIAAMGGLPLAAVGSTAFPRDFPQEQAREIHAGVQALGDQFACPLIGGDVGVWDGPLAITITVLGRCGDVEPVLRSGAKPGDAICVTGRLGGAWASRRHLEFVPRVREGRLLAERYRPHAMIDLSDGLATDLRHICAESTLGADLDAAAIPIHDDVPGPPAARLRAALTDGEDYELLFTLPSDRAEALLTAQDLGVAVARIGTMREGEGITFVHADGRREPLTVKGWEHRGGSEI